ncbi:unnamed protein product [Wickerhamomyces anomalus]
MSTKLEDSMNLPHNKDGLDQDIVQSTEDFDILDEFLDRRLYDQPQDNQDPSRNQQQSHQNVQFSNDITMKDDEMFTNFLTDELNKNDFLYFNGVGNDNQRQNGFDITNFGVTPTVGGTNLTTVNHNQLHNSMNNTNNNNYSHQGVHATTPNSIDLNSPESVSKHEVFTTPNSTIPDTRINSVSMNSPFDPSYETSREILSQLKFGSDTPAQFETELPKEYLEADPNSLPYKMEIKDLPTYSRVETQIKLDLSISPPPPQFLVHLPADTIAKQKLCLKSELSNEVKENMLFLDTYVLTATSQKSCNICARCVKREQKRASRRKSGVSDNLNWGTNTSKRAVIFNCKEVISFPPAVQNTNTKDLEISARIVCYCRHHQESKGFKLLFILKDSKENILAKHVSSSIMIMDRKKTLDDNNTSANEASNSVTTGTVNNSNNNSDTNLNIRLNGQPLSPTSIEEDSSEPHTTDSRVFKRKRTWSPELSDGFSIAPSRKPSYTTNGGAGVKRDPVSPASQLSTIDQGLASSSSVAINGGAHSVSSTLPTIQRIIPSQGPLRGGVEVTLLGSNFRQGLTVKFGINKALSTHCWSDSTIVTYLPPASQPGQVIVSFEENNTQQELSPNKSSDNLNTAIFTYLDDSDRQLIELALQIVGLKMNGKLEDARNIARKIIGSDANASNGGGSNGSETSNVNVNGNSFNNLQSYTDEELVSQVINLLPSNPNWSLCTQEGQTLLHLSCLKGYYKLVSLLIRKGARVDSRDVNGFTPLHFASLAGDRNSIELLINCKANLSAKSNNGSTPEDVADSNVLDLFKYHSSMMQRKFSNSSISSSIFSIDDDQLDFHSGAHVSRLVNDHLTDHSLESDDYDSESVEAGDEESDDVDYSGEDADYEDDEDDSIEAIDLQRRSAVGSSSSLTQPTDVSLWNKVRNVFNNTNSSDTEDLPKYDDLYPSSTKHFTIPKLRFTNSQTDSTAQSSNNSSDESEDIFIKFFHQRKNVQNDKMLLFFWLPLLILIISFFILINSGWTFSWNDQFQQFVRSGLGKVMLGNERVKVAFNRHFSQMNEAVTSVINVNN